MNAKKSLLAILLSAGLVLNFSSCTQSAAITEPQKNISDNKKFTVGICQIAQHPSLDAATKGFIDAIEEELPGQVKFENQNASNDIATCGVICNGFAANEVDLILANATPSLQAASSATVKIPILGTAVTEYGVALNLDNFSGTVGGNISGTSDLSP